MKFVDRKEELQRLEGLYLEEEFHFIPVYGRRRIGKTRLIAEFIKGKPAIFYMADSVAEVEQLRNLARTVGEFFDDPFLVESGFKDWYQFFEYMRRNVKRRMVLIIDEFPHLVHSNKAISSIFQKGIDQYLKETPLFLILMGSSVGMMEREVLFQKAPLYGRRTGELELGEMSFNTLKECFSAKKLDELVAIYGVMGAVPAYLEKLDPAKSIFENIEELVLTKGTFLYSEVEYLLREELREPRNYFVILRAISQGKRKLSEIINDTGFEKSFVSKYLEILRTLRLVEKEVPITEKYPEKSKSGLYRLHDRFIEFWFKFVFPNRSKLEIGRSGEVLRTIKADFDRHLSFAFEYICREYCLDLAANGNIRFSSIGRWWLRNEEIDIVALDEERAEIYLGEVKWSRKPVGIDILERLREKAQLVEWKGSPLKGKIRQVHYMLFSRSGFTDALLARARDESVLLISGKSDGAMRNGVLSIR
jgi:uncharacterized protein